MNPSRLGAKDSALLCPFREFVNKIKNVEYHQLYPLIKLNKTEHHKYYHHSYQFFKASLENLQWVLTK